MFDNLKIIYWPDPRLLKVSKPVESFDDNLRTLTREMFQLMRDNRGVGLAAPQVGVNLRLFVIGPTGNPEDERVYINPVLSEPAGHEEDEEGCLSLPDIRVNVLRSETLHMKAQDLDGKSFEETQTGYIARIWQHENDHLDGVLILQKMGPLARMTSRKKLRELEAQYLKEHPEAARDKKKKR